LKMRKDCSVSERVGQKWGIKYKIIH